MFKDILFIILKHCFHSNKPENNEPDEAAAKPSSDSAVTETTPAESPTEADKKKSDSEKVRCIFYFDHTL